MKLWLSKNSEVPVRDQIVTQITIGIASGDLAIGDKLPSTNELSRRYEVHPNTVGAAYRSLVDSNLLEFRQGSGYYVCDVPSESPAIRLESIIDRFFDQARSEGFSDLEIYERIEARRNARSGQRVLIVESDEGLGEILSHEISKALGSETAVVSFEKLAADQHFTDSVLVAMFDEKPKIDPLLIDGNKCIYLKGSSVSTAMSRENRPDAGQSIAVVSGWDNFLTLAKIMLLAAKIEPGNLIVRSTKDSGWKSAIKKSGMVICDSLTAEKIGRIQNIRIFRVIADESIRSIKEAVGIQD